MCVQNAIGEGYGQSDQPRTRGIPSISNHKKVDLGNFIWTRFWRENHRKKWIWESEQNSGLSRFRRFAPRNRKNTDRRLFLPEKMAPSGDFELLSSSKLPLSCILCNIEKYTRCSPPSANYLNIYLHIKMIILYIIFAEGEKYGHISYPVLRSQKKSRIL